MHDQRPEDLDPGQPLLLAERPGRGRHGGVRPLVAAEGGRPLVGDGRHGEREQQRHAGQVRALQAGGRQADHHARRGGDGRRRRQLEDEVGPRVGHEQTQRVGAHRHEPAVAERDLAVGAGEQAQPGQHDDVGRDLADLVHVVLAQPVCHEVEDNPGHHRQRADGAASAGAAAGGIWRAMPRPRQTRLAGGRANMPSGRAISATMRRASAPSGSSPDPR